MDLLIILAIIAIPAIAQVFITKNYNQYKQVNSSSNLSGCEVARKILDANGLQDVHVVEVRGCLSDHYDPSRKVVRLSKEVFHGMSVAATSIAAHECGHAIQDQKGYFYMRFRSMIFPIVKFSSYFAYIVLFIGLLAEATNLFAIGIALVSLGLLFQLVTLPVEFNASSRAKEQLKDLKLVNNQEARGVENMLTSAAMTYVAGVLSSVLDLLRLILIFTSNRD